MNFANEYYWQVSDGQKNETDNGMTDNWVELYLI